MALSPKKRSLTEEQRRALRLLARGGQDGYTEAIMLAHGFTISMLAGLVLDGLATAATEIAHADRRPIMVVRVRITDAGRQAIGG
jgi:hypothetical protein